MSITKRQGKKSVVYEVKVLCKDKYGQKSYISKRFKTKKEVKQFETKLLNEQQNFGFVKLPVKKTLNQVFDEFMAIASMELQQNTIYSMQKCKKYFENDIGKMQITEICFNDLQTYFANRSNEGLEINRNIRKALNKAFIYAIRNEYISVNPITYLKITGVSIKKEKNPLTYEEIMVIVHALLDRPSFRHKCYIVAILIGFYTGLRVSEVFALEKSDFDFNQMTVNVNKKLVTKGLKKEDYFVTSQMKSRASKSILPIPTPLKDILILWYDENPYWKVICDENAII